MQLPLKGRLQSAETSSSITETYTQNLDDLELFINAIMKAPKIRVVRPNLGGALRPQAETPRRHFLYTDVTREEQREIQQYCLEHKISVSQFLADLVLETDKLSIEACVEKVIGLLAERGSLG